MKRVKIAELKARLSEHLRDVRRGQTLTVLDRGQPIARIVPYVATVVRVRKPSPRAGCLSDVALPPPLRPERDIVALLLEDRKQRR